MKCVILAGGEGQKFFPFGSQSSKSMLQVLGAPALSYTIQYIKEAGIRDVAIVTKESDKTIESFFKDGSAYGLSITYFKQEKPGIHGAILSVKEFVKDSKSFMLCFADVFTKGNYILRTLITYENKDSNSCILLTLQKNVRYMGAVRLNPSGSISHIEPVRELKSGGGYTFAGCFILPPSILQSISEGSNFIDCIDLLLTEEKVAHAIWEKEWVDLGFPWDILDVHRLFLGELKESKIAKSVRIGSNVSISGCVVIKGNVVIHENVVIRGPVYIDEGSIIGPSSYIREFSSIGKRCKIDFSSEIKGSIIMDNSTISSQCYIVRSIVGKEATIQAGVRSILNYHPGQNIILRSGNEIIDTRSDNLGFFTGPLSNIGVNCILSPGLIIPPGTILPPGIIKENPDFINEKKIQ